MLSAVLFDLDGTLLDISLDCFLRDYFAALGPVVAEVVPGISVQEARSAVLAASEAMSSPHPGVTNRDAFNARFQALTEVDLDIEEYALPFERFYREVFPSLRGSYGPTPGARNAVKLCIELGLRVAIATNPIFPRDAIMERMRWAGIADLKVQAITTYENMHSTKPHPAYFAETADMLGVDPASCIMVGDDRALDMPAADLGMRTFYVGSDRRVPADWNGTLRTFEELLPRLLA